ncbi:hypothetical protein [Streptomyces sp. KR80]|uniref:hypothetical protein n=1 Tax=Streptomyces sp. KR80 TaxID=3457426 RepID=UPI003FD40B74
MIYDLLLAGPPVPPQVLAEALTEVVGAGAVDVDVADTDEDQSQRDWTAPILCGYRRLRGDVSQSLDVYLLDALVDETLSEREFAQRLAAAVGAPVLYPAVEDIPSAYWVATPSGTSTRARLLSSDDVPPVHTIDAVESPVAELPHVRVIDLPEIAREHRRENRSC